MKLSVKLLSSTTLALALVISQPLLAAENPQPTTATEAAKVDDTDLTYAADHLLNHVSNAILDLNSGANDEALKEVESGHRIAVALENAAPQYTTKKKVQAGRIVYKFKENNSNYYIPLADEAFTKRTYKDGPFWSSDKGIAVKKAQVVYVTIKLDTKKAKKILEEARDQINKKDYGDAQKALLDFNKSIVSEEAEADLPLQQARDNFFLARMLILQKNYDGARYALNNADNALDKAERKEQLPERKAKIKDMRAELKDMKETIKTNDPTAFDKAVDKLQNWWDESKDWVTTKI